MAMGACPGQIPMPCVPPALMVTATTVRACRYIPPIYCAAFNGWLLFLWSYTQLLKAAERQAS